MKDASANQLGYIFGNVFTGGVGVLFYHFFGAYGVVFCAFYFASAYINFMGKHLVKIIKLMIEAIDK